MVSNTQWRVISESIRSRSEMTRSRNGRFPVRSSHYSRANAASETSLLMRIKRLRDDQSWEVDSATFLH
jgi:hypothetical protein